MAKKRDSFLGGYRVLDLTDEKGFFCAKILGDLGADVIKIESPRGDPARNNGPFHKDVPHPERSLFWFYTNLNKRGITLNIETTDGRELFKKLVKTADIVTESFAPGYMDSLGLGYSELERISPSLIMTSITPFGQSGPYAHYRATDLVGVSMAGLVRLIGELDRQPNRISAPQFYFFGGLHAAMGSMVALYHRELTGEGQYVDVSCQQAVVLALMLAVEIWDIMKLSYRGTGPTFVSPRPMPPGPLFVRSVYPCSDGHVLLYLQGGAQAGMAKSSKVLVEMANEEGMALELKDYDWPQYDGMTITQEERNRLEKPIMDYLLTKTKAELLKAAVERGILMMPTNTTEDVVASEQLKAREFWVEVEHPELGETITYPGFPIKWSELPPCRPKRRAPLLGEHNQEVYEEEMGLSRQELVLLSNRGII
jgi:benzylsuccinate CoA-transferase BbsE subunit